MKAAHFQLTPPSSLYCAMDNGHWPSVVSRNMVTKACSNRPNSSGASGPKSDTPIMASAQRAAAA